MLPCGGGCCGAITFILKTRQALLFWPLFLVFTHALARMPMNVGLGFFLADLVAFQFKFCCVSFPFGFSDVLSWSGVFYCRDVFLSLAKE